MPYVDLQQSFDAGTPAGARYHYRSRFLRGLPDDVIDDFVERAAPLPGAFSIVGIEPMGGAVARVPVGATAFPHRDAAFNLGIWAGWADPGDDERITTWAWDLHEAMAPQDTGGVYVNYLDADEDARMADAYGSNLARLAAVKQQWDPDNLFRVNHNITPKESDLT